MGDFDQFEQFMEAYKGMVYSTAMRLVANEADALDVAQEVFVKAHRHFDNLRDNPAAGGWLKKVARNCALNHLVRYRARWRFFSEMFGGEGGEQLDSLLPVGDGREDRDDETHRKFYLEKALQKLPAAQRVPLVLYHFEDLTYEEIAGQLKSSLSKVKTDIHRGRQSLRRWLKPDMEQWDVPSGKRGGESEGEIERNLFLEPGLAGGF